MDTGGCDGHFGDTGDGHRDSDGGGGGGGGGHKGIGGGVGGHCGGGGGHCGGGSGCWSMFVGVDYSQLV